MQILFTEEALVGLVVSHFRKRLSLNLIEVAPDIGLMASTLQRIEAGKSSLSVTQLRKLCTRLEVPIFGIFSLGETFRRQLTERGVTIVEDVPDDFTGVVLTLKQAQDIVS